MYESECSIYYKREHEIAEKYSDGSGQKTIYKYLDLETQKIANSIYINMQNINPQKKFILNANLSPGLIQILLQKGYMYIEDVYEDEYILEQQLTAFGFAEYSLELRENSELRKNQMETKMIYVLPYDQDVLEYIEKNRCESAKDFIEKAEYDDDEKIEELAQTLSELYIL